MFTLLHLDKIQKSVVTFGLKRGYSSGPTWGILHWICKLQMLLGRFHNWKTFRLRCWRKPSIVDESFCTHIQAYKNVIRDAEHVSVLDLLNTGHFLNHFLPVSYVCRGEGRQGFTKNGVPVIIVNHILRYEEGIVS